MKRFVLFLFIIIGLIDLSSAISFNNYVRHTYDNIDDSSVNQSLWTNFTAVSGSGTTFITENTDSIRIQIGGSGSGSARAELNSTLLPNIDTIKGLNMSINLSTDVSGGGIGSVSFNLFGNLILTISGDASDDSNWNLIRNISNPSYLDVYNDGTFNRSILPTENIIRIYANGSGSSGLHNYESNAYLKYVYYYDNFPIELISPANSSLSISNPLYFNATVINGLTSTVTNSTLTVFNSTGVYARNHSVINAATPRNISLSLLLPIGIYSWNYMIWANNGSTNISFSSRSNYTFTYGFQENSISYTSPIFEAEADTLILNLTLGTGTSLTGATLIYNGTHYASTINQEGNNYSIINSVVTPLVTANSNISFNWNISINDGSQTYYFLTTTRNQSINDLVIDNCTVNSNQILNYTIYDEDTLTFLTASTYNTTTDLFVRLSSDFTGENYIYYTNQTTINPIKVCISSALVTGRNYRLDSDVRFSSISRVTEYHIIENLTINTTAVPVAYKLYDLLITNSQEFILNVKDSNFLPVQGAIIEIQRQYLSQGTFLPIEIVRTDIDGRGLAHLVLGDEVYTFYVRKNGELLGTFPNVRAVCQDVTTGNCQINLNSVIGLSSISTLREINGVRYSLSFDRNTSLVTLNFISSSGDAKDMRLSVVRLDLYNNLSICNSTLVASSGQITCTVSSSYGNISIQADVFADSELIARQTYQVGQQIYQFLDKTRYLLAAILIITLPLMSVGSPVIALVFFIIGLILAGALFMVDFGGALGLGGALIWLICAVIVLIWKASRRRDGF